MKNFINFFSIFPLLVASQSQQSSWPTGTYVPNTCVCASAGQCSFGGGGQENDGTGTIEARIMGNGADPGVTTGTTNELCSPVSSGINLAASNPATCASGLERCCPSMGYTCGVRYPAIANAPTPPKAGHATYGAFPFQVVVLTQLNEYIGTGVAIDQYHMLTAAHKISNVSAQLKIRIGDWDAANNVEPYAPYETNITFVIHPNFTIGNLKNNIAVLRAENPIPLGVYPTIATVCLPNTTLSNLRCWTSGWGKDSFGTDGGYQNIIKEVDVPLVDTATCQDMLRQTRLGKNFVLDPKSFICAGGEGGKDACTGDGGAPLSCFVRDRFYLVGLVAWGIGCGLQNSPGVYVNIQNFIPWIQQTTASFAVNSPLTTTTGIGNRVSTTAGNSSATSSTAIGNRVSTTTTSGAASTATASSITTTASRSAGVSATTSTVVTTSTSSVTTTPTSPPTTMTTTTPKPAATTSSTTLSTTPRPASTTVTTSRIVATTTPSTTTEAPEEETTKEEEYYEEGEEEEAEGGNVEKPGPRNVHANRNQKATSATAPTRKTVSTRKGMKTTKSRQVEGRRTKAAEKTTKKVLGARKSTATKRTTVNARRNQARENTRSTNSSTTPKPSTVV